MSECLRLDKWLWYARFFKSRTLSAERIQSGRFRVNGTSIAKPSYAVRRNDVVTFPLNEDVRVIKVLALGTRRGPAPEAQTLYEDLDPAKPKEKRLAITPKFEGGGRPTKRDRRAKDKFDSKSTT
ncbi:MAG: RNA-binding S4 domain-containing protein [Pseudomonadota bacterium]